MKSLINNNDTNQINFPIDISTNNKDSINHIESKSQPRTAKDSSPDDYELSIVSKEKSEIDSNITYSNNSNINNYPNLKFLTKYKNIFVPKIFLINYEDTSIYPPIFSNINESQNNNNFFKFSFPFFTPQNNTNKDYLNYGYNFNQWKIYATEIKNTFDELNELVMKGEIKLPEPNNELEYLMAIPSDYGGLGNVYNDHIYKNVKFYDPKAAENKDKKFMTQVKIEKKMIWFPLYPNPESLNNNNNPFKAQYEFLKKNLLKNEEINKNNKKIIENQNDNNKKENNTVLNIKKDENLNENNKSNNKKEICDEKEKKRINKDIDNDESSDCLERSRDNSRNSRKYINYKNKYNKKYWNDCYNKNKYYNKYKYNGNKYYNRNKNRYYRYIDYYDDYYKY